MTDIPTYHRGDRNFGTGYDMMKQIEALEDEIERLRAALTDISRQKKTDELDTEYDVECADFEGGYDLCIDRARAALTQEGE